MDVPLLSRIRRTIDTEFWDLKIAWMMLDKRSTRSSQISKYVEAFNKDEARLAQQVLRDDRHLHRFESSIHSQNGEDGIIREIFARIAEKTRTFVEIGASDGDENCTAALADRGWQGFWIEVDAGKVSKARGRCNPQKVKVIETFVDRETILSVLDLHHVPGVVDLLVIDIDGNDYWIWQAIAPRVRARAVVVEYNAVVGPHLQWVMPYRKVHRWDESCRHGAGLNGLTALAASLGYTLVGCDSNGVNAFFVLDEEAGAFTQRRVKDHFVGPRYGLPYGHPVVPPTELRTQPLTVNEADLALLSVVGAWPASIRAGGLFFVHLRAENGTSTALGHPTSNDLPTNVAWWWIDQNGRKLSSEPERSVQPWHAEPGQVVDVVGRARAPESTGQYHCIFRLVQESVRWLGATATALIGPISVVDGTPSHVQSRL